MRDLEILGHKHTRTQISLAILFTVAIFTATLSLPATNNEQPTAYGAAPQHVFPRVDTRSPAPAKLVPPTLSTSTTTTTTTTTPPEPSETTPLNREAFYGPRDAYFINDNLTGPDRLFRTECDYSHLSYDDPIVAPGQAGATHLHMYFGNTEADAHTDYQTLMTTGEGTCNGGQLNRSAYWTPALLNQQGDVLVPSWISIYYKTLDHDGDYAHIEPYPEGLKIIAGDATAQTPQDSTSPLSPIDWSCDYDDRGSGQGGEHFGSASIPTCQHGQAWGPNLNSVRAKIRFPFCWNGNDMWLPKSAHMSYPVDAFQSTNCPASHPVVLPSIEFHIYWDVPEGVDTSTWWLSSDEQQDGSRLPGGTTLHADWFGGWDRDTLERWVANCSNVSGAHCGHGLLGTSDSDPALTRLQPHFGPYSRLRAIPEAEHRELCPARHRVGRCS